MGSTAVTLEFVMMTTVLQNWLERSVRLDRLQPRIYRASDLGDSLSASGAGRVPH